MGQWVMGQQIWMGHVRHGSVPMIKSNFKNNFFQYLLVLDLYIKHGLAFFWFSLYYFVLVVCFYFFQYYAKRLAGKNVSEVTNFVTSGT